MYGCMYVQYNTTTINQPTNLVDLPFIRGIYIYTYLGRYDWWSSCCEICEVFEAAVSPFPVFCSLQSRTRRSQQISSAQLIRAPAVCGNLSAEGHCVTWEPASKPFELKTADLAMPSKKIISNKSSRRRLNTGSVFIWTRVHSRLWCLLRKPLYYRGNPSKSYRGNPSSQRGNPSTLPTPHQFCFLSLSGGDSKKHRLGVRAWQNLSRRGGCC